jgi:MoaA/NifB/PqqE/SkfB family radical SAM enzyme
MASTKSKTTGGIREDYYSPLKIVHHQDRIDRLRRGERILPTQVMLNITNVCNHHCTNCYTEKVYFDRGKDSLPLERVLALLDEFRHLGVRSVHITGGGEPTIHTGFHAILERMAANDLRLGLVTNGSGIRPEDIPLFSVADWVRFSMDAGSEAVHRAYHGNKDFRKIVRIIQELAAAWPDVVVGYSFVLTPENYTDVVEATRLAKQLGCRNIRITPAHTGLGAKLFEGIWDRCVEMVDEARALEDERFRVFAQMERIQDLHSTDKRFRACHYQQFVAYIRADGTIHPCCELQDIFPQASIIEKPFLEGWMERDLIPAEECPRFCYFSRQNELVDYLLLENPPHVDYV